MSNQTPEISPVVLEHAYTKESPRPVPAEFTRDGMRCRQIKREGRVVMVALGQTEKAGVEVMILSVAAPSKYPNGEDAPWREKYPGASQFGTAGWYYTPAQLEKAHAKYAELVAAQEVTPVLN
jgi:hypothetical protein